MKNQNYKKLYSLCDGCELNCPAPCHEAIIKDFEDQWNQYKPRNDLLKMILREENLKCEENNIYLPSLYDVVLHRYISEREKLYGVAIPQHLFSDL